MVELFQSCAKCQCQLITNNATSKVVPRSPSVLSSEFFNSIPSVRLSPRSSTTPVPGPRDALLQNPNETKPHSETSHMIAVFVGFALSSIPRKSLVNVYVRKVWRGGIEPK